MATQRKGYRISIFWEEFGTLNEGGIEDIRNIEIASKPSKKEMDLIERLLTEALRAKGRLRKNTPCTTT
jgi:hypothetical protein